MEVKTQRTANRVAREVALPAPPPQLKELLGALKQVF